MATRRAWVLNLDADLELGAKETYAPRRSVTLAIRTHVETLSRSLLGPDDVLLDPAGPAGTARGFRGRAFCPTPRALDVLRRAGTHPEPHPSFDVLRRVNSRAFASALGPTLEGAAFVVDLADAEARLRAEPVVGDGWRVKHPFGMAGRNQRVVFPSRPDDRLVAFLAAGLQMGGLQIEPNVPIEEEYAMHGFIAETGRVQFGALVRQHCDARGAWIATEPISRADALPDGTSDRIAEEVRRVATALGEAGFFGPFGVDAYAYRDRAGRLCLQPRSEINARYSMGYAVGWGGAIALPDPSGPPRSR